MVDGATTDDAAPTLGGTTEPGSRIDIYDNGILIGTSIADSNGQWSFTPSPVLTDGEHALTATVTDPAGNTSVPGPAINITLDTEPNTVTLGAVTDDQGVPSGPLLSGQATDDTQPELTGQGKPGSTVTIKDGATVLGTAIVNPDGSWSFTPATPLSEGTHTLTVESTDPAGNTVVSGGFDIKIDTQAPSAPTIGTLTDDVGGTQGTLNSGDTTDDPAPKLNGGAEPGSRVDIYDNGTLIGTVIADSNGLWTFTPSPDLSEGEHRFTTTATDAAGNISAPSPEFVLTTVYTIPVIPVITNVVDDRDPILGTVPSGGATNDATPEISGTAAAGATVTIYNQPDGRNVSSRSALGSVIAGSDGNWVFPITTSLPDGTYNFLAIATQGAGGNSYTSNVWTVTIDGVVSNAVVAIASITEDRGGSSSDFITSDNTLLISGTLDKALLGDEWIEVSLNNGTTWSRATNVAGTTWSYDLRGNTLVDNTYTITARVVDNVGNLGSSASQAMTISTQGRDMTGLNTTVNVTSDTSNGLSSGDLFSHSATAINTDRVTRDTTVTITGNLSSPLLPGESFQLSRDNGITWVTIALVAGNSWSYILPVASASTTYELTARVLDNAGNVGQNTQFASSYKVVIDLESPNGITVAPIVPQTVNATETFTFNSAAYGLVETGAIVSLVSDVNSNGTYQEGLDKVIAFVKANADGTWSLSTTLPAGAHNLAFLVWDEAGNRSTLGASSSVGVTAGTGSTVIQQTWGGTTENDGWGLNAAAVTISTSGLWSFFQSVQGTTGSDRANAGRVYNSVTRETYTSVYLAEPSTSNGAGFNLSGGGYGRFVNAATFADINRDGYSDVLGQVSDYGNSGRAPYWLQNADGTFSPRVVDQGALNHFGGVIAYDRHGDGYLDFVLADSEADSITFLKNTAGTLTYEKSGALSNGHPGGAIPSGLVILHELGAVDIDNNGTVDVTAHIDHNGAGVDAGNLSRGLGILYNQTTGTAETNFGLVGYYANVFRSDGYEDQGDLSISMTYADFNKDGWLDLFLSRGSRNSVNGNENRIYLNDGTGKLNATDAQALWFGDNLDGSASLAVDWNHDGRMDVVEVPRMRAVADSPTVFINKGNNVWTGSGQSLTGATKYTDLTGAVALDYDWDGSMDLVMYVKGTDAGVVAGPSSAPTLLVKNTNIAADGTSLQIRIVDGTGINSFYSNTVKLYDSAGNLVATQLINPQSSGSSNSMGLVSFYGLNSNEVYSVQMLRITNGQVNHVGATASMGGYTNGTVNANWGGLTTEKSHDAYVLTAENTNDGNNTVGSSGIIGTGYNDTFFSSAGDDTYQGGGGWSLVVSGNSIWGATAGMDVVDYRNASAVVANLQTGAVTGHGTDKLIGIEGLRGTSLTDNFTDNAANNLFEGRAGNDIYNLNNGGNDTLLYRLLSGMEGNSSGGNGHDSVHGFKVANLTTDGNADQIDFSELLSYSGPVSFFSDGGVMTLDYSSRGVQDYLKVEILGSDTVVSIDRDGSGGTHTFTQIITLADVQTDLITLLQNNQIMV
ncbi:MAG: Ig-like domain-containing protein [Aeromonas veronii]